MVAAGHAAADHTGTRDYRGIDGRAPVTGTEWEYEEALQAARSHARPTFWHSAT